MLFHLTLPFNCQLTELHTSTLTRFWNVWIWKILGICWCHYNLCCSGNNDLDGSVWTHSTKETANNFSSWSNSRLSVIFDGPNSDEKLDRHGGQNTVPIPYFVPPVYLELVCPQLPKKTIEEIIAVKKVLNEYVMMSVLNISVQLNCRN